MYAKDLDSGANSELDYSIKGAKAGKGLFKIHTKSGMIATKALLKAGETHDILVSRYSYLWVQWCCGWGTGYSRE